MMLCRTLGDGNIWLDRWLVLPVFGNVHSLQQLVHLSDVAWAVVQALEASSTNNRQFNISGALTVNFNDVLRLTADAFGRHVQ